MSEKTPRVYGSRTEGRVLGNDKFIQTVLGRQDETLQAQIGIESLVAAVARVYEVPVREMTSASRARQPAQARAMATLIGVDQCGYRVSEFARHFNRDMPGLSRQVKALRARLEKNTEKYCPAGKSSIYPGPNRGQACVIVVIVSLFMTSVTITTITQA